jgi:TPR repeat protein
MKRLVLLLLALFSFSCNSTNYYELAKDQLQIGNRIEAKKLFSQGCEKLDFKSCTALGSLEYDDSQKNIAEDSFKKACEGGEISGCVGLGVIGIEKNNYTEAQVHLKKACDKDEMRGCYLLGYLQKNQSSAETLYKKACAGNIMEACNVLGDRALGKGNFSEAQIHFEKSCEEGLMLGCGNLGLLEKKKGNLAKTKDLYKKACNGGELRVCNWLGVLEEENGNIQEAQALYKKACDSGDAISCNNLNKLDQDVSNKNNEYQKSIDIFNSNNQDLKSVTQAYWVFAKLCKEGFSNSCENKKIAETTMANLKNASVQDENGTEDIDSQINKCNQGNKDICWGLFISNKGNEHGYGFLRNACLFGHKQACNAKSIIDQEKQINQARAEAEAAEQEKKSKELSQSVACFRDAVIGAGLGSSVCNPNCPNYQDCLERRREIQDRFKQKRSTTCRPDIAGGFRCTEN